MPSDSQSLLLEKVIIGGDLSRLTPAERLRYYQRVCESLGLNPLTRPFECITLNGRLTLYARRDATDQLRRLHGVSITIVNRERIEDVYVVTARATINEGTSTERRDEATGAVSISGLRGDALANALMKAETKAKRRATLSIVGLGWLDETEVETIPDARPSPSEGKLDGDVSFTAEYIEQRLGLPPLPTPVPTPVPDDTPTSPSTDDEASIRDDVDDLGDLADKRISDLLGSDLYRIQENAPRLLGIHPRHFQNRLRKRFPDVRSLRSIDLTVRDFLDAMGEEQLELPAVGEEEA